MSVRVEKWVFTVDEYHRMAEAGILSGDDRVELIEGEIVKMSPIGRRHAAVVNRLNAILNRRVSEISIVSVQNPIQLDDYSEPQPDLALLRSRDDFYAGQTPGVADVLLIIEVADSSLDYDRDVKVRLYAKAGISETWLVNLTDERIEAYSGPLQGEYQKTRVVTRGDSLSPDALPGITLSVDEILG